MIPVYPCPGRHKNGTLVHIQNRERLYPEKYSSSDFYFDVRYLMFDIRYSLFDIRYSIFDIRYSLFDIRYSIFVDLTGMKDGEENIEYRMTNLEYKVNGDEK